MRQHRIPLGTVVREVGEQDESAPDHPIGPPDQASLVALALHRIQLPLPFKPHPLSLAQGHPEHRSVGAGRQLLRHRGIQLLLDPDQAVAAVFGIGLQGGVGKPIGSPCCPESISPLRGVPGERAGLLVRPGLLQSGGVPLGDGPNTCSIAISLPDWVRCVKSCRP
jgi:hypothetical protein